MNNDEHICKNCGVILNKVHEKCPLCGNKSGEDLVQKAGSLKQSLQMLKKKRSIWEAFGIIAICLIALTILTNLIVDKQLSWALFAFSGIVLVWSYYTIFIFSRHFILIWVPAGAIVTIGFLFFTDSILPGSSWFIPIALPLTVFFFILAGSFVLILNHVKYQGFNMIGYALLHIASFCLFSEIALDMYFSESINLRWSLFAAIAAIPVAFVLLFIHYRLNRGNDLKSFFHI